MKLKNALTASGATDAFQVTTSSEFWITVIDGGGTGFNSGTATVQQSFDNGTTWITFVADGSAVTFTSNDNLGFRGPSAYYRVLADASISDVDVHIDGKHIKVVA